MNRPSETPPPVEELARAILEIMEPYILERERDRRRGELERGLAGVERSHNEMHVHYEAKVAALEKELSELKEGGLKVGSGQKCAECAECGGEGVVLMTKFDRYGASTDGRGWEWSNEWQCWWLSCRSCTSPAEEPKP